MYIQPLIEQLISVAQQNMISYKVSQNRHIFEVLGLWMKLKIDEPMNAPVSIQVVIRQKICLNLGCSKWKMKEISRCQFSDLGKSRWTDTTTSLTYNSEQLAHYLLMEYIVGMYVISTPKFIYRN